MLFNATAVDVFVAQLAKQAGLSGDSTTVLVLLLAGVIILFQVMLEGIDRLLSFVIKAGVVGGAIYLYTVPDAQRKLLETTNGLWNDYSRDPTACFGAGIVAAWTISMLLRPTVLQVQSK